MVRTSRTAALRQQLNAIARELARLESMPEEPEEGSVIKFQMLFPNSIDRRYTYAALRAGGRWYTTGNGPQRATWDDLLEWMEQGVESFELLRPAAKGQAIPIGGD